MGSFSLRKRKRLTDVDITDVNKINTDDSWLVGEKLQIIKTTEVIFCLLLDTCRN